MSRSHDGAAAATAAHRAGPPAWILLDNNAYIDDVQNASTATAWTSTGLPIRVTLAAAEPPRDSYFCVHCPCLKKRRHGDDNNNVFAWLSRPHLPSVVYSNGDLALLCVPLSASPDHTTNYFIYRAGRRPSLRLLPGTYSGVEFVRHATVGVVPVGGDADHFALAALGYTKQTSHELHVFRSDRGTWTTTPLVLGSRVHVEATKAIALGGGDIGWVDLRRCILVCDVLSDDPNPRLVPLPKLLPCNLSDKRRRLPREYRDVVFGADGSITCVEIEHCVRRVETRDVSTADVPHDSELTPGLDDDTPPYTYHYLGWRIITWNRAVSSNCWRKRGLIHVDDIVDNDPGHTALLLPMAGGDGGQSLTVRHLAVTAQVPSLSIHGGDIVYIMAKANQFDKKTWMLAVDMAKKTLEEVAPISAEESGCPSYISCALSNYL